MSIDLCTESQKIEGVWSISEPSAPGRLCWRIPASGRWEWFQEEKRNFAEKDTNDNKTFNFRESKMRVLPLPAWAGVRLSRVGLRKTCNAHNHWLPSWILAWIYNLPTTSQFSCMQLVRSFKNVWMLSRNSKGCYAIITWNANEMQMKCNAHVASMLQQVAPRVRQRCHVLQVCLPRTRLALKASTNTYRQQYIEYTVSQISGEV